MSTRNTTTGPNAQKGAKKAGKLGYWLRPAVLQVYASQHIPWPLTRSPCDEDNKGDRHHNNNVVLTKGTAIKHGQSKKSEAPRGVHRGVNSPASKMPPDRRLVPTTASMFTLISTLQCVTKCVLQRLLSHSKM